MKYIFVTGAPGSKWSSVCKSIYYSPSIDRTDYSEKRTYYHSAWGQPELMHLGAYFDPGMEFGKKFLRLEQLSKKEAEAEFDRPFKGDGVRIIKSHVFAHHLDYISRTWDGCPIVMVHRPDDACLGWWVRCGQFNIKYPNYQYYSNLEMMGVHINQQNKDILDFAKRYERNWDHIIDSNMLANVLNIDQPPVDYWQNYPQSDVKVTVL